MLSNQTTPLLTTRDVADILNVSRRGLAKLVKRGQAPQPIRVGRLLRWSDAMLAEWIAQQRRMPGEAR